jgi:hypothetical protein
MEAREGKGKVIIEPWPRGTQATASRRSLSRSVEVCAIAEGAVCFSLRQLTRIAGIDLSRFTFVMNGTLMSASTKVARVHACHLTIGDQKTEGRCCHSNARRAKFESRRARNGKQFCSSWLYST